VVAQFISSNPKNMDARFCIKIFYAQETANLLKRGNIGWHSISQFGFLGKIMGMMDWYVIGLATTMHAYGSRI
jgi:hypothetical protein